MKKKQKSQPNHTMTGGSRRRTSPSNSPSVRPWGKIIKSSDTRSSPRLTNRRQIGQYAEQPFVESSLNESFSSSHIKEVNVNNGVDPLNGSPNAKLPVNSRSSLNPASMSKEWQLVELHSNTEETTEGSSSLPRVAHAYAQYEHAIESVCQAVGISSHAPSTATSRAAQDCDKKERVVAEVVSNARRCTLEESHSSRESHPAAPSSSPIPVADNKTVSVLVPEGNAINIGGQNHSLGRAFSSNLTEVINMFDHDSVDEAEVELDSPSLVNVYGYSIKEASAGIVRGIIEKHGDIAAGLKSARTGSCLLERVCGIVETLQKKSLKDVTPEIIQTHINEVTELGELKMRVDWLLNRLEKVYEARTMVRGCYTLQETKCRLVRERDEAREEMERCVAEKLKDEQRIKLAEQRIKLVDQRIKLVEEKVNRAEVEIEGNNKIAKETKAKILRYREKGSVVDGLL